MEFLDDVLNKAKDVFYTAYRKTEKAVSISKQKMDISSMRTAIAKRYEKLGREVITELDGADELPSNIASLIEDIRSREELLRLAEEQLGQEAGKFACSACGSKNRSGAKFCNNCGAELR